MKSANGAIMFYDDVNYNNVYYNPELATDFIRICKILPLRSGISCSIFESDVVTSSSANIESEFNNVKQSLADMIPCSADTFVESHIEMFREETIRSSHNSNYLKLVGDIGDGRSVSDIMKVLVIKKTAKFCCNIDLLHASLYLKQNSSSDRSAVNDEVIVGRRKIFIWLIG